MSDPSLAPAALETWQVNAKVWDENHGVDGGKYWKVLQEPCLERLLGPRLAAGQCHALELSTGNGICARWLAARGAKVTATDGSSQMIERAKGHGDGGGLIDFAGTVDVTVEGDYAPFVERGAAVR